MNAIQVSVSKGKVTIENPVCRWGLLELPRRARAGESATHNRLGEHFLARAVCESKEGKFPPKEVTLHVDPGTALAVQVALGA